MTILRSAMVLGLCSAVTCPVVGQIRLIEIPGAGASEPLAISGDGSTVVGYNLGGEVRSAFNWPESKDRGGLFPSPSGYASVEAAAVNFDGSVAIGNATVTNAQVPGMRAVRWQNGVAMDLGVLPGRKSARAYGLSQDGAVVAGVSYNDATDPTGMRAFRWSVAGGMQDLGVLPGHSGSYAKGVSADGSTVVGVGVGGPARPFRWTEATGMAALDMPAGAYAAWVEGVSGDGSTVIGVVQGGDPSFHASMWEGSSARLLDVLPGMDHSWASDITNDGSLIVGHAIDFAGRAGGHAVLWDSARQMVDLESYASSMGVDVSRWELWSATGVSDDGTRIVGIGMFESAPGQWIEGGWVMSIPAPGGMVVLGAGLVLAMRRRRPM